MTHQPFDAAPLALNLLRHEAGGASDPVALAAAAERTLLKLSTGLLSLLGGGGVHALAGRALRLAHRQHALLASVSIDSGTMALPGLLTALQNGAAEQRAALGASIPEHFLVLLVTLLGEDVGLIPVRKIWPDLPLYVPGPSLTETSE